MAGSLSRHKFSRTRAILQDMLNTTRCPVCTEVAVNPVNLGSCPHFFCDVCVEDYNGGKCPAPSCTASAPAKATRPDKLTHAFSKTVYKIKQLLGDEIPERMQRHMSTEFDDEEDLKPPQVLQEINGQRLRQSSEELSLAAASTLVPAISSQPSSVAENVTLTKNSAAPTSVKLTLRSKSAASSIEVDSPLLMAPAGDSGTPAGRRRRGRSGHMRSSSGSTGGGGGVKDNADQKENMAPKPTPRQAEVPGKLGGRKKRGRLSKSPSEAESPNPPPPAKRTRKSVTPDSGENAARRKVLEKRNRKGETALHSAAVRGDKEAVVKLLGEGANPNTVDNAGWSPLHEASIAGRVDLVKLLLEAGASPNLHAQEENLTPLHDAAANGHLEVVRLLVARGADVRARNSQGQTPVQVARSEAVVRALEDTSVEVFDTNPVNQSPIVQEELTADRVVLACPNSSDAELKKILLAAAKLGMSKPNRAVRPDTTHCLLDTCLQPASLLAAQLVGARLVRSEWILQCRQLGRLVDTEPFLLDAPDLTAEGRQRALECRARAQPKLMTGLHIYLAGVFEKLNKVDLQRIVNLSGAKLINREPNPETIPEAEKTVPHHAAEESSLGHTSHLILYQEGGKREPLLKYNMEHVKTLPLAWFVASILQHQLLPPELYL